MCSVPWDIDEAVLRRLVKRIFVPLPDAEARQALIMHMMQKHGKGGGTESVTHDRQILARIVHMTQGYSGSDLTAVRMKTTSYTYKIDYPFHHIILRCAKKPPWDRSEKYHLLC